MEKTSAIVVVNTLALLLLILPFVSFLCLGFISPVWAPVTNYDSKTSQLISPTTLPPGLQLLGAGARWAAGQGNSVLYVDWKDNWAAHHLTDGSTWSWPGSTADMDGGRYSTSYVLQQYNLSVTFAGDIPKNLSGYDLMVFEAYYAIEPSLEPQIRNYIFNGGGVVFSGGVPFAYFCALSKNMYIKTDLTPIQEWFGAWTSANAGGNVIATVDHPGGTSLLAGDNLGCYSPGTNNAAAVVNLHSDSTVWARWDSGAVASFTHEYGKGRVYFHAAFEHISSPTGTQVQLSPRLRLLGGGAKWAAGNGSSALFVDWKDNYIAHHLADGATWGPWPSESWMDDLRSSGYSALTQYGLNVEFAGDLPQNLTGYDVVVIQAYWTVEPSLEPVIRNYILNGGGVVILSGIPVYFGVSCKDWWPKSSGFDTNNLSPIEEWFGGGRYVTDWGSASLVVDNPFGTELRIGDIVFTGTDSHAAVTSLHVDAQAVAQWSGLMDNSVFAFTHTYGQGRIYYQSDYRTFDVPPGSPTPTNPSTPSTNPSPPSTNPPVNRVPTAISISTSSPSTFVGFAVGVNGTLRDFNGIGLTNQLVVLYYTFPGFGSWIPITSSATDNLGRFHVTWIPPATGYFSLKASWAGNATHAESSSVVSLSTVPYKNECVFSVESNSTITALAFNSTSLNLSFVASGQNGTRGYLKVTIAKNLVADIADVKVFLDENEVQYSAASSGESWLINFNYAHSTHHVSIRFPSNSQTGLLGSSVPAEYGYGIVALVAVAAVVTSGYLFLKRKKRGERK